MISLGRVSTIYGAISQSWAGPRITSKLFWEFSGPWEDWTPYYEDWFSSDTVGDCLHYGVRMFAVCNKDEFVRYKQQPDSSGLGLCRVKGEFPTYGSNCPTGFQERRISLGYCARGRVFEPNIVPRVKLVLLAEVYIDNSTLREQKEDLSIPGWHWYHYIFYAHVHRSHEIWEGEWNNCLDKIDQCIRVKVCNQGEIH